jgi:hypothetical protein
MADPWQVFLISFDPRNFSKKTKRSERQRAFSPTMRPHSSKIVSVLSIAASETFSCQGQFRLTPSRFIFDTKDFGSHELNA